VTVEAGNTVGTDGAPPQFYDLLNTEGYQIIIVLSVGGGVSWLYDLSMCCTESGTAERRRLM